MRGNGDSKRNIYEAAAHALATWGSYWFQARSTSIFGPKTDIIKRYFIDTLRIFHEDFKGKTYFTGQDVW